MRLFFQFSWIFDGGGGRHFQLYQFTVFRRMDRKPGTLYTLSYELGEERANFHKKNPPTYFKSFAKHCSTMQTLRFADFFIHVARGRLGRFSPAIIPIPVRNFIFKVYSGRTKLASSSIVKRSHRYFEDFARDSPAICLPRKSFFLKFDFDQSFRH